MIKYSMLWVINSDINLPCHLPFNEKWKLREGGREDKVLWQRTPEYKHIIFLKFRGLRLFWHLLHINWWEGCLSPFLYCVSNHIPETRGKKRGSPKQRKEGENGRWKKPMMEREGESKWWGKAKSKREERRAGKGSRLSFWCLWLCFFLVKVFQRPAMTLNTPNCQKQLITQCWLNGWIVCVCVHLGCNRSDRDRSSSSIALLRDWTDFILCNELG